MKALNIMLIGIVLTMLLVGCVKQASVEEETGVSLAPEPTLESEPRSEIEVSMGEWFIKPTRLVAKAGEVTFVVTNDGNYYHEFEVEGNGVGEMVEVQSETTVELTVTLTPGTYKVYCPIPGHEEKGQLAELIVS